MGSNKDPFSSGKLVFLVPDFSVPHSDWDAFGYNHEYSSRHLLPTSELLKTHRITFDFEGNAPPIYLNAFMFAQIIRDAASPTEEVNITFLWIFANRLS